MDTFGTITLTLITHTQLIHVIKEWLFFFYSEETSE